MAAFGDIHAACAEREPRTVIGHAHVSDAVRHPDAAPDHIPAQAVHPVGGGRRRLAVKKRRVVGTRRHTADPTRIKRERIRVIRFLNLRSMGDHRQHAHETNRQTRLHSHCPAFHIRLLPLQRQWPRHTLREEYAVSVTNIPQVRKCETKFGGESVSLKRAVEP
jgi:hypothetical protein